MWLVILEISAHDIQKERHKSYVQRLCFIEDRLVTLEVHSLLKVSQPFHTYTTAEKARVC